MGHQPKHETKTLCGTRLRVHRLDRRARKGWYTGSYTIITVLLRTNKETLRKSLRGCDGGTTPSTIILLAHRNWKTT